MRILIYSIGPAVVWLAIFAIVRLLTQSTAGISSLQFPIHFSVIVVFGLALPYAEDFLLKRGYAKYLVRTILLVIAFLAFPIAGYLMA